MEFIFLAKLQVEDLQLYQKYALLQIFSKIFAQTCSFLKEFLKILRTSVSQKKLYQRLLAAADYDLRKPKMLRVSNGNLLVLKCQNIHVISNLKYTAMYNKAWRGSLLYIQQRRILFRTLSNVQARRLPPGKYLFSQKAPSYMFEKVLNTLLSSKP